MMHPEVLQQQTTDTNHATVTMRLPAELAWFRGHFPQHPILPGVAQVNWAMQFAAALLPIEGDFSGMEVLKFQRPILPLETVTLALEWQPARQKLLFSYCFGEVIASSGKIALCR
ncbi:3-hydroxyacyl-ACP dehydratase FabZ family protein [Serratia rubidaea]|uniref:3-hydroxyacyl-ACP dehydratase FabZ family protein n=1 Tax=Serratia rubidaea TaxID=61652 RepID=UPI001BAEB124|nr:hydroxymyristoyl-ACP dehydratase [Serratia rubidaea]MBS0975225.1 hydroxymyristoyl-ACP dehydratase [Serratia rubidaea]